MNLDLNDSLRQNLHGNNMDFLNNEIPVMLQKCIKDNVIVITNSGKVKGKIETSTNGTFYTFKGIPYAKPPLGDLRFAKSVQPDPWDEAINANESGPSCVQSPIKTNSIISTPPYSEDCLQLNIFVPHNVSDRSRRPVMIWIHGGGFTIGQGTTMDGSILSLFGDVIVVAINYRLNVFGFLSVKPKLLNGNYGMYDQQLAIKWIKENIMNFGGDPEKITIFGESAGGMLTTLQAIMPSNKGLFKRVIAESGSALRFGIRSQTKVLETSKRILDMLQCSGSMGETMVCLRNKTTDEIFTAYSQVLADLSSNYSIFNFIGPVIDGELIVDDPLLSLEDSNSAPYQMFTSVDLLAGCNTGDMGIQYQDLLSHEKEFDANLSIGIPTSVVCDHIAPVIARDKYDNKSGVASKICTEYSPKKPNATIEEQSRLAIDLFNDLKQFAPMVRSLELHSERTGKYTYQYMFAHTPRWELLPGQPSWLIGPFHASEIVFVFGQLHNWYPRSVPVLDDEISLSERMMGYWTNFARAG